jgi:acyl-CoA thioesterase I
MNAVFRFCAPLTFLMLAAACGLSASTPAEPSDMTTPRVVPGRIAVLGDSLSVSPSRTDAFPAVLQKRLRDAGLPWVVTNAGVSGDTTTGGLRRLNEVLAERPDVLILALGANDGLRGADLAAVSRNLGEMITRAKAQGVRVLLCGMETPPLRGWNYTMAFHNVFPALAREHDVPLVPFLLAGVALDPQMNLGDMIHPNTAGARRIADTVWPYLEPLLQAEARATSSAGTPRGSLQ